MLQIDAATTLQFRIRDMMSQRRYYPYLIRRVKKKMISSFLDAAACTFQRTIAGSAIRPRSIIIFKTSTVVHHAIFEEYQDGQSQVEHDPPTLFKHCPRIKAHGCGRLH